MKFETKDLSPGQITCIGLAQKLLDAAFPGYVLMVAVDKDENSMVVAGTVAGTKAAAACLGRSMPSVAQQIEDSVPMPNLKVDTIHMREN